jgi:hypothetical protein
MRRFPPPKIASRVHRILAHGNSFLAGVSGTRLFPLAVYLSAALGPYDVDVTVTVVHVDATVRTKFPIFAHFVCAHAARSLFRDLQQIDQGDVSLVRRSKGGFVLMLVRREMHCIGCDVARL